MVNLVIKIDMTSIPKSEVSKAIDTAKRLYEEADVVDLLEGIKVRRDADDFRSGPILVGSITVEHV